jgi:hypothetical protein
MIISLFLEKNVLLSPGGRLKLSLITVLINNLIMEISDLLILMLTVVLSLVNAATR